MTAKATAQPKKIIKQQVAKATSLRERPIFKDRVFIGLVVLVFALCAISIVILVAKVRPKPFVVPLHYSTLEGFDSLGPWYRIYLFGLFSLFVTIGNTLLAVLSYPKSRIGSFFLLLGTLVVNIFSLVVIATLVSHLDL